MCVVLSCNNNDDVTPPTLTDIDGNVYNTTIIGTQTWMTENLKTTKYNDGTAIRLVTDNATWASNYKNSTTIPMMCYYDNSTANAFAYGALYNWYVVKTDKLCPAGWHVPTDAEWTTLTNYVGEDVAGTKLKATSGWNDNGNGTDDYGFKALPGGYRDDGSGTYSYIGDFGGWWSASAGGTSYAWDRRVDFNSSYVYRFNGYSEAGLSVRCLRD